MTQSKIADISRWQGIIDWNTFSKQIDGVVIKAGGADGGLYRDGLFTRNRDEARRTGVPRWFYWYKGGAGSPRQQAEYFVSIIGGLQANEGLVLDDENEGAINVGFCAEFADRIKQLTGLNVVIYSNQARFRGDLSPLKARDLGAWVAKYGANTGTVAGAGSAPSIPTMAIIMWQYTSQARVPGVTANTVDMNIFYGDVNAFKAYGAKSNKPAPSPQPQPQPTPAPGSGYYVVVSGDTLSAIGARLGLNWQDIARWNGITAPYTIYPGQKLKVFGGSAGQVKAPANTGKSYTVVRGDTLSGIGAKTGVSWQTIAQLNGIKSPYIIYPGQILKLGGSVAPQPSAVPTYTVRSGDYLVKIGERTGVAWQTIAKLNGIKPPYTIYPGQVLRLK